MQFKSIIVAVAAFAIGNAIAGPLAFPLEDSTKDLTPAVNDLNARSPNFRRSDNLPQFNAALQAPTLAEMTDAARAYAKTYANQVPSSIHIEQFHKWRKHLPDLDCWNTCPFPFDNHPWGFQSYFWLGMCNYFPDYWHDWKDCWQDNFCPPLLC